MICPKKVIYFLGKVEIMGWAGAEEPSEIRGFGVSLERLVTFELRHENEKPVVRGIRSFPVTCPVRG